MITVCNSYKDATHIQYMYMQYVSLSVIKMAVWYCCYKPCNSLKKYSAKDIIHHSMSDIVVITVMAADSVEVATPVVQHS